MFTLPKPRRAQPWQEQISVRRWLSQLFAIHSRKSNYHVTVGTSEHIAWVNPEARRVYVTNALPAVPPDHVRFDPVDEHRRTEMMLKGLIAHEAGHVRFSGPKPDGKLGYLCNCLEDERIERRMAAEHPALRPIFTFMGDVLSELSRTEDKGWSHTAMEGVLLWRYEHDRHATRWTPREQDHDIWHAEIRPRVEQAWKAQTAEQMEVFALEIMTLLREHQEGLQSPPPGAPAESAEQESAGEDQPSESGSEAGNEPGESGKSSSSSDGSDQSDESGFEAGDKPGESGESSSSSDGSDQSGESGFEAGDKPGESGKSSSDSDGSDQSDESGSEAGDEPGESGESSSSSDGDQPANQHGDAGQEKGDTPSASGEQQPSDGDARRADQGETGHGDEGAQPGDTQEPSTEADADRAGQTPSPQSNVSSEEQAAENGDDNHVPGSWKNVSSTGADADERDGDAQASRDQQADPQVNADQASPDAESGQGEQPHNPLDGPPTKAQAQEVGAQSSGQGVGEGTDELPPMPEADSGNGSLIADGVEGYARKLAPLLKPPGRPGRTRPHRSKGRFDARRDAREAERVFMRKTVPSRPMPIKVRLLIDVSTSMRGAPLECARAAASMVVRAAALSGSSAEIHLFNTRHEPVVTTPMLYTQAQDLVAGIKVDGGTRLAPALLALTDTPPNPLESELIVVICDGQLTLDDYRECATIVKRGQAVGKRYLPVLISQAAAYHGYWREVFGSALPCESVTDLAVNIKAALTSLRGHLGT